MKKTHLNVTGYTGGQSPGNPEKEANEPDQSETNENEPNNSQIQSDVFLVQYTKLGNQPKHLEEVVESGNQVVENTTKQLRDAVWQSQHADKAGQLDESHPENGTELKPDQDVPSAEFEMESDVVLLEFLSENEQKANENMNKILANLNKSSVSIKEKSKSSSFDEQSAKSNQQFMEEQIESDDFMKQSISAYDNDEDSSQSLPLNRELLEVTKGFVELPRQHVTKEDDEVRNGVEQLVVETELVKEQEQEPFHLDAEYTGPVRSIFGPEPIQDYPNSLEELLCEKPKDMVVNKFSNFHYEPYMYETRDSTYEIQSNPSEGQVEMVPATQSSPEPNYDTVIRSKENIVERKISSEGNILLSHETTIEQPCVTGELIEPNQEQYNDLRKLSEILKAGLEDTENNEPKEHEHQQDNSEANAPEPNPEETQETLLIKEQAVTPSKMLEFHQIPDIKNVEAVNISNSRQLQMETSSRHSDPGATDAGTRKGFKEEIKYLSGHPQFRYLDAVSSATNLHKNSGEETTDICGGGKSGDGTLNVGTNISTVSQVGQVKSKVSLGVDHISSSDSVLYQDSQIVVKKPKHQESGISQMDNRSDFDNERRNFCEALVENKKLIETGPVIRDGDDAANENEQTVIATSDHQRADIGKLSVANIDNLKKVSIDNVGDIKVVSVANGSDLKELAVANFGDLKEASVANFGELNGKSASTHVDQPEIKKSVTDLSQTKQGSTAVELEINEQQLSKSIIGETDKVKVRVEFKELQNLGNQEMERLQRNEQVKDVQKLDEPNAKNKTEGKDAITLPSSQATSNLSSQLLKPIEGITITELATGQEVNHPSVYSIYMQPNNANVPQAQNEIVEELKLGQRPQRTSNENMSLKSIKKSVENVIEQRVENLLSIHQTTVVVKKDSSGTPEISRTMKQGDISKPEPKQGTETESSIMDKKNEEKEMSPGIEVNLEPEVHIKPSETTSAVAEVIPKVFESNTVLPSTKASASELNNKVSIVEEKKDLETTLAAVLTVAISEDSNVKIASDEKIVEKLSILQVEPESSEVIVSTIAEQPPIKLKVSEPFSNILKQDSISKIPEPIPKEQRGRILTTPETKKRISKELFTRSRSGSLKKASTTKSQLHKKDSEPQTDQKSTPPRESRAVVLSERSRIRRTKFKRFANACSKFFKVNKWFKKRRSSE